MLIVHVHIRVKPGFADNFMAATRENARASRQEPGIVRFDVVQQEDDPTRFVLIEIYRSADDPGKHKATSHYAKWREAVEPMMAEPRRSVRYSAIEPTGTDWEYPGRLG